MHSTFFENTNFLNDISIENKNNSFFFYAILLKPHDTLDVHHTQIHTFSIHTKNLIKKEN